MDSEGKKYRLLLSNSRMRSKHWIGQGAQSKLKNKLSSKIEVARAAIPSEEFLQI
jgi:hypothetical protein